MSNQFLFELGTEEIPADMIEPAAEQMEASFRDLLSAHCVECDSIRRFSTPRRLAILMEGLPVRCPDREEVLMGPPRSVGLDASGLPTAAAAGFARKSGLEASQLEVIATQRGEYLAFRRRVVGDELSKVIGQAIPELIAHIAWPKNMYWSESRFRFIRPLRWFLSLWNDQVVPFEFEGVKADRLTRGHRFLGADRIEVPHADQYCELLRRNFVVVDPAERREIIEGGLRSAEGDLKVRPDAALLETVVHLNEFPSVLAGSFNPKFLEIPGEVLVTVMRYHQKYFSLADSKGRLASRFLTVINTDRDREGLIRKGHEKVLQARLEDAAFFWENDRKRSLEDRRGLLGEILFQERLGTYLEKTKRIEAICVELDPDESLRIAARLCKADLTTGMVREFPELQGVMGGLYADREGYPESVWRAVYEHYRPVALDDAPPASRTGVLLSIADRLDTIVGCFGIDIVPTGSSDPFALRRQAQGLVALLHQEGLEFDLKRLIETAWRCHSSSRPEEEVCSQVLSFLQQRIQFIFQREGLAPDLIRAVLAAGVTSVPDAFRRARALQAIRSEPDFEALAAAFKRTRNILEKYKEEVGAVRADDLIEEEEKELFRAYLRMEPTVRGHLARGNPGAALEEMAGARGVIDRFFDKVLVMDRDERLRKNRLALLSSIAGLFLSIADISEVVQQGEKNGA